MTANIVRDLLFALVGALIAEFLDARYRRSEGRHVHLVLDAVIVVVGTLFTGLYFQVSEGSYGLVAPLQYAVFLVLAIKDISSFTDTRANPAPEAEGQPEQQASSQAGFRRAATGVSVVPGLILNGWLSVSSVGSFGALVAEIHRVYRMRTKQRNLALSLRGLLWSLVVVLTSGLVTVLHGVDHVNALTAAQLGAAGPLVASRLRL